jgi:hypothetical protein
VERVRVARYVDIGSARRRRSLERSLRGVLRSLDPKRLPGASPLNRPGLWLYEPELRTLATRVGDLDRPASNHGLQLLQNFLTDAGGPLYDRARIDEVPETVRQILVALDGR